MSDDAPLDLTSLMPANVPEVVGPAVRRFSLRIALVTLAIPVLWLVLPWAVATWWHNLNADFNTVRSVGFSVAPASRGEMKRFADTRLHTGESWRAYSWRAPQPKRGQQQACWAVFFENSRLPDAGCQGPDEWNPGASVASNFSVLPGKGDYTVVGGVAPAEARRVDVVMEGETQEQDSVYPARTTLVKGTNLRVFVAVLANSAGEMRSLRFDARDANDRPISPKFPYFDTRQSPEESVEAKAAASAAVKASGDPAAIPYSLFGPTTLERALIKANIVDLTADPNLAVYEVSLHGSFPRPGGPPGARPTELISMIVAASSNQTLFELFPAR